MPRIGSVRLVGEGASDGALLAAMADWLLDQILTHQPSLVAYEAPLPAFRQSSVNSGKIALRLTGIVELICWRRSIRCQDLAVNTVRAKVVGRGNAKKEDVQVWLEKMGWPVPLKMGEPDKDAIDAAAVWAYCVGIRAQPALFAA